MGRPVRLKVCMVKIETVYGTDAAPVAATDSLLMQDSIKVAPVKNTKVERNLSQIYMGNSAALIAGTNMEFEVTCELQGSGIAGTKPGAALDALLQALGTAATVIAVTSVTYNPISAAIPSCTIYYNRSGLLYKLVGARVGSADFSLSPQGIPTVTFKGLGLYGGLADAALPAAVYTAYPDPYPVNNANTNAFALGGFAALLYDYKFTVTNKIKYRNIVGAEDIILTDRSGSASYEIEEPTIAAKDFYAVAKAGTIIVSSIQHGQVAGKKCKFDLKQQLMDPNPTDRDGNSCLQVAGDLTPVTGNDEFVITLT